MRTATRWGLFNLIGTGGFIIQTCALAALTRIGGWHYVPATVLAVELAIVHNFFAHARWTWRDRRPRGAPALARTFARYQLAKTMSLAANVALTAWIVRSLAAPVEIASAAAVLALSIVNFLVADALVFTPAHTSQETPPDADAPATGSDLAKASDEVTSCDSSLRPLRSS